MVPNIPKTDGFGGWVPCVGVFLFFHSLHVFTPLVSTRNRRPVASRTSSRLETETPKVASDSSTWRVGPGRAPGGSVWVMWCVWKKGVPWASLCWCSIPVTHVRPSHGT